MNNIFSGRYLQFMAKFCIEVDKKQADNENFKAMQAFE